MECEVVRWGEGVENWLTVGGFGGAGEILVEAGGAGGEVGLPIKIGGGGGMIL